MDPGDKDQRRSPRVFGTKSEAEDREILSPIEDPAPFADEALGAHFLGKLHDFMKFRKVISSRSHAVFPLRLIQLL